MEDVGRPMRRFEMVLRCLHGLFMAVLPNIAVLLAEIVCVNLAFSNPFGGTTIPVDKSFSGSLFRFWRRVTQAFFGRIPMAETFPPAFLPP